MPNRQPVAQRLAPVLIALLPLAAAASAADATDPLFSEHFDHAAPGKPDKSFLIVAGGFEVKDVGGGNLALELPGEPLETFGAMFGPADQAAVDVRARVWAASTGRRFPEFGIGAGDVAGYRLLLLPRQRRLVLRKADVEVASVPYDGWRTETWTAFRLTVAPAGAGWRVTGTARPADGGDDDAKAVSVVFEEQAKSPAGRGSVWGIPFSGRPIRFDDIEVRPAR